jgi:carboxyl-terminal processing protease
METTTLRRKELVRAILRGSLMGVFLGAVFAGGYLYRMVTEHPPASEVSFDLVGEADALLARHFYGEIPDETTRIYGAVRGMVASLNDPYTFFMEPPAAEVDAGNLAGVFGGIGAEISRTEEGYFIIVRVYRDNPAAEADLQADDIILAVDGAELDISTSDMNEAISRIRGPVGEPVVLTILREEERFDVELIRVEVLIPSVIWEPVEEDPRVGYILVTRFTERSPEEMQQAIDELRQAGVEAYVLDLRNNGGGLVDSAVGVVSEFLDGGLVLSERRIEGEEQTYNAVRGGAALDEPLVVLVNEQTASASEIVGGALQDRERAILIGQQTFGKGSVQVILPLSDGSSLHVTTAEWFTPSHHPIDGNGLLPDIVTEPVEGRDAEIEAALDYLHGIIGDDNAGGS